MCTRYITPEVGDVERHWHVGARDAGTALRWPRELFPGYTGPIVRADPHRTEPARELVTAQWNLIPWFAKERKLKYPTANARSEELAAKASYKQPWARGQRCIIPAAAFFEPCWETGRHVPWIFRPADGSLFGLAGLWAAWTDPATGEVVDSYTLLTINADGHPLMGRMHRPDPDRPPGMQDKRSVIPVALADVDTWLHAPPARAQQLMRLWPAEAFAAEPGPAAPTVARKRAGTPRAVAPGTKPAAKPPSPPSPDDPKPAGSPQLDLLGDTDG